MHKMSFLRSRLALIAGIIIVCIINSIYLIFAIRYYLSFFFFVLFLLITQLLAHTQCLLNFWIFQFHNYQLYLHYILLHDSFSCFFLFVFGFVLSRFCLFATRSRMLTWRHSYCVIVFFCFLFLRKNLFLFF